MITTSFQVHLEAAGQWDRWVVEIEINLKMILGAQAIPLSYVIRENNTPNQIELDTWEEKAVLESPFTRRIYKQDNLTVHNILLRNIADESDAFTYMKLYIKKDDERTEIKALRSRYENAAMLIWGDTRRYRSPTRWRNQR